MNTKLKELISISAEDATSEDDESLVDELKNAKLLMPIEIISADDFSFKPLKISNDDGDIFIPLFTDEDELVKSNTEFSVISISSENLAEMLFEEKDNYSGVAVNPFSEFSLAVPLNEFLELFKKSGEKN